MGSWGITMRQSDYGLDLLGTIVNTQLKAANFTIFHVTDALEIIKADIMEEIRRANRGCPAADLIFYFSQNFPVNFTQGALLIAECLADYYRTGELIVTEYVGEKYDPVDHHIKEFVVTGADLKILLDELQSVQNPEHWLYQSWFGEDTRQKWLAHIQAIHQVLKTAHRKESTLRHLNSGKASTSTRNQEERQADLLCKSRSMDMDLQNWRLPVPDGKIHTKAKFHYFIGNNSLCGYHAQNNDFFQTSMVVVASSLFCNTNTYHTLPNIATTFLRRRKIAHIPAWNPLLLRRLLDFPRDRMKKRDLGTLAAGMVLGAALTGGAAAAGVLAEPSWQNIYVDGKQVQMTAYNIAGNNYVKLRDIGKEVGFNVYWQDGVQVDSTSPYTGKAPAKAQKEIIRISSYKGTTLKAGDRSGLIISSGGSDCTVTSSNPAIVTLEKVSGSWVAVAKTAGTATITVSDGTGGAGSLTLTVEAASAPSSSVSSTGIDLNANMEVRQEMIRLINQVRREHGVAELTVNEALMNATQDISTHRFTGHTPYEWEAISAYGWPHGGFNNQTCFNQAPSRGIARHAVENWVNSPYHLQALLCEEATCLGVGVTVVNDFAYCHMFVGDPNSCGPL